MVITAANSHPTLDAAEKHVEDQLLQHVHNLSQRWLVDPTVRHIYYRTMLHDALTSTTSLPDGAIGPSQLLKWAAKAMVPAGEDILQSEAFGSLKRRSKNETRYHRDEATTAF